MKVIALLFGILSISGGLSQGMSEPLALDKKKNEITVRASVDTLLRSAEQDSAVVVAVKRPTSGVSRWTLFVVSVAAVSATTALVLRILKKDSKPAGIGLPVDFPIGGS